MAKYKERIKARIMRRKGISIIVIARELGVSKSTVSLWCRDIILSKEQIKKLESDKKDGVRKSQLLGAESNKNKRLKAIELANLLGREIVGVISKRELMLIATALYWGEGSKSLRTGVFLFVNSDPLMILVIKRFLNEVMKVSDTDIVCRVQINCIHEKRIGDVLNFWKNLLKLSQNQIKKPYYINTKSRKIYENYDNYYGVCRLRVCKGTNLKYKLLGLIKAISDEICRGSSVG